MSRLGRWLRWTWVFAILLVGPVATHTPAWAQADGWTYVFTPQLWTSHIAKNGFVATSTLPAFSVNQNVFRADPNPADPLDPQWGFQLAAQKGRWTLGVAFQYVDFETLNDITFRPPDGVRQGPGGGPPFITNGERAATESVQTTRADLDLAASYFFPDVVKDRLDLSLGGGVKFIYAQASRQFENVHPTGARLVSNRAGSQERPGGLYAICKLDDCSDQRAGFPVTKDHVNTDSFIAAVTIPMAGTFHLANKWLASLSVSPLAGIESRDDHDVVYRYKGNSFVPGAIKVVRLDGTTRAFGGTSDVTLRYLLSDTVSLYAAARAQYINGHAEYLAWGPMIGMSVRFGGN